MLRNFEELLTRVDRKQKKKIVVAMAQDSDVLHALEAARAAGMTEPVLVGSKENLKHIAEEIHLDLNHYEIVDIEDEKDAVDEAVSIVKKGDAQVLMKGLCSTSNFLKGILDKENGLRASKVLSHLAIFETPNYKKLLFMSDAAMNITPDLTEKIEITENAIKATHSLGYELPRVAMISAVEKVNAIGMPSTADAAIIAKMGDRKQIKDAIIDGPLAVDNALSPKANLIKGLDSPVGGDADICIVPNIEAGNIFYKVLTTLGNARVAGVILGAAVPVVLTSRADSENSKFLSIAAALSIS
jgi:phosphate butyryltransferase